MNGGERSRLRFVAPLRSKAPPRKLSGAVAFLPMEAIGEDGSYDESSVRPAEEVASAGYTYFQQGDVVRARVTPCFENGKGALLSSLVGGCGVGTTELFVLVPSPKIDPRFLYYVTTSREFTEQGAATMYGAHGVRRVDDQFVRDYGVWVPPVETQRAIADHLDRETARIDLLIAAKRRLITMVTERFEAARDRWIWVEGSRDTMRPLRRACSLIRDGTHQPPQRVDDGYPLLSVRNLINGRLTTREDDSMVSEEDYLALTRGWRVQRGDVALAIVGTVGKVGFVGELPPVAVQRSLAVLRPAEGLLGRYLYHAVSSAKFRSALWSTVAFSAQPGVYLDTVASQSIPIPPNDAQERIVRTLDEAEDIRDRTVEIAAKQINLLEERRQSLISTVVTGQLDIPEPA